VVSEKDEDERKNLREAMLNDRCFAKAKGLRSEHKNLRNMCFPFNSETLGSVLDWLDLPY